MTRATYEAMHREIRIASLLDLERAWSERRGLGAAGAHKLMCQLLEIDGDHEVLCRFLYQTDQLPNNVIQGPW